MKKKCKFVKIMNAFLDNELPEKETAFLREHIKTCRDCQNEIRDYSIINQFLGRYQDEDVPKYLSKKILAEVKEKEDKYYIHRYSLKFTKWALAASVGAAFLIGAYLSNMMFSSLDQYSFDLGEDTLFSYFEGVE